MFSTKLGFDFGEGGVAVYFFESGDLIVRVNGIQQMRPPHCCSGREGVWGEVGRHVPQRTFFK